ncbi:MAG: response regulator [Opitutaceae bacterium]|nr:response regulator [Opitutaceae bacterium]
MPSGRILIVDDTVANLQLASFLLKAAGFSVNTAASAQEGIEKARSGVELILMDVQMSGMDGLTATRLIKADAALAHIPVVALTANAMQGDKERCLEAGCVGYITKPINTKQFASTVTSFLKAQPSSA